MGPRGGRKHPKYPQKTPRFVLVSLRYFPDQKSVVLWHFTAKKPILTPHRQSNLDGGLTPDGPLRGIFPSFFIYITEFTKRPEATARTTASGRILGGIFDFLEKLSKNWSKFQF